jgi:hypothetical protein
VAAAPATPQRRRNRPPPHHHRRAGVRASVHVQGDAERRGAAGETEPARRGEQLQRLPPREDTADRRVVRMGRLQSNRS